MNTDFFDDYTSFYTTSTTASAPNRLNNRYRALIASNSSIIGGARILDVASHDGRWSFAALKTGATHVLGIEAREYLVDHSVNNMQQYGIAPDRFSFVIGDIHDEITRIPPGSIDVVFLFGFFYHTIRHTELLMQIRRLDARHLIIDTAVAVTDDPIILLEFNDPHKEAAAVRTHGGSDDVLVGRPSKSALEYFLSSAGFDCHYFDWHGMAPASWDHIDDYRLHRRVTAVATRQR